MYVKRGARGMEVIPNLAFWKDLPFLVKVTCSSIYKHHLLMFFILSGWIQTHHQSMPQENWFISWVVNLFNTYETNSNGPR